MREYIVDIGGLPHTLLLDAETAKLYGDRATPVKAPVDAKAKVPANKARTPERKS